MHGATDWQARRYIIFICVLLLHIAIVAVLLKTASPPPLVSVPQTVQLLIFPPEPKPKVHPDNTRPRSARGDAPISIIPPELPAWGNSPTAPGFADHGSGVDWNAEARRAVQAFEIRKDGAAKNDPNPGALADDNWWPRAQHHAGEQYKTDEGDWIVWINTACYQIANSAPSSSSARGAVLARTICPGALAEPRGDISRELRGYHPPMPNQN